MAGGSSKGFPFEREVSKKLSLWISGGDTDSGIWRSKGSGGRGTARRKKGIIDPYDCGDLTFDHPRGKPLIDTFLIEVKRGYNKTLDVLEILDRRSKKKPPVLVEWWRKAESERQQAGRPWTQIIMKRDQKNAVVVIDYALFESAKKWDLSDSIVVKKKEVCLAIVLFDYFYERIEPRDLEWIRDLRKKEVGKVSRKRL